MNNFVNENQDLSKHFIATIHGGAWEVLEYSERWLSEIRRVNRDHPDEIKFLGIFPSKAQACEACARHVSPKQNRKRLREINALLNPPRRMSCGRERNR